MCCVMYKLCPLYLPHLHNILKTKMLKLPPAYLLSCFLRGKYYKAITRIIEAFCTNFHILVKNHNMKVVRQEIHCKMESHIKKQYYLPLVEKGWKRNLSSFLLLFIFIFDLLLLQAALYSKCIIFLLHVSPSRKSIFSSFSSLTEITWVWWYEENYCESQRKGKLRQERCAYLQAPIFWNHILPVIHFYYTAPLSIMFSIHIRAEVDFIRNPRKKLNLLFLFENDTWKETVIILLQCIF